MLWGKRVHLASFQIGEWFWAQCRIPVLYSNNLLCTHLISIPTHDHKHAKTTSDLPRKNISSKHNRYNKKYYYKYVDIEKEHEFLLNQKKITNIPSLKASSPKSVESPHYERKNMDSSSITLISFVSHNKNLNLKCKLSIPKTQTLFVYPDPLKWSNINRMKRSPKKMNVDTEDNEMLWKILHDKP